jgi:hypothetical protein
MTACCHCAKCRCYCHQRLTEEHFRQMTQEVLEGRPVARIAARYHLTTGDLTAIVHARCRGANQQRYEARGVDYRPSLYWLRIYAADYGYTPGAFYARRREELAHA